MKISAFLLILAIGFEFVVPVGLADRILRPENAEVADPVPVAESERAIARDLFDIGVLVGRVEQGTLKGADPRSLVSDLEQVRERALIFGGLIPLAEIDALIEAMENAKESRDLHDRIVEFRKALATRVAGEAQPRPVIAAEPFDCDQGSWEGVWETTWGDMTLVFEVDGKFHGTYGSSQHAVSGKFDPDSPKVLRGRWNHFASDSTGGIRFEMKAPSRFEGGWSYKIPVEGAGSGWSGTRRRTHHSEILIVPIGEATIDTELEVAGKRIWSQRFLIKKGFSVRGGDVELSFLQMYTLASETGERENWGPLHDLSGAGFEKIPAGGTFSIGVSFPEEIARRQIVFEFGREAEVDDEESFVTLRTRPLRLVPPQPSAKKEAPPDGDAVEPSESEEAPPDRLKASTGETVVE